MRDLSKRQIKTIKLIGRWADGHCTHCKAEVTKKQLCDLGVAYIRGDSIILTSKGRDIYKLID